MVCLFCRQLIYNYPEQLFSDAGVMAIEHADFEGVERLALVTGQCMQLVCSCGMGMRQMVCVFYVRALARIGRQLLDHLLKQQALKVLSRIAGLFPTDRMGIFSFHFAVLIYCVLSQLCPEDSKMQLLVSFGFLEISLPRCLI